MKTKTGLLLILLTVFLLLINRFVFSPETSFFSRIENENIFSELYQLSVVFMYLSASIFLHTEKELLNEFNIDRTGILLFIGSSLFIWVELNPTYYFIVVLLVIWMVISLINKWSIIKKTAWESVWPTVLYTAIIVATSTTIFLFATSLDPVFYLTDDNVPNVLGVFAINFGLVAPTEEFLFRCILWGYLNNTGTQTRYSFVLQGALFWLLHYKSNAGLGLFISLPMAILLYSFLAQKFKQLTPSIISHSLYNTFLPIIWKFLF
jgi:membrane protease YdiL (CAAX protease family)